MPEPRAQCWDRLGTTEWDLLIVGGGAAGAGLLREAGVRGVRAALVEQNDIAWGASGRSSKLIHGGLRYLQQGRLGLTRTLLRERDRLLAEAPGLVQPLPFILMVAATRPSDRALFSVAITLYELLRHRLPRWQWLQVDELVRRWPELDAQSMLGGWRYPDACTDDARLVWRLLESGVSRGGVAMTYVRAESLLLQRGGVAGVIVRDRENGQTAEVRARTVVNATGAWGDTLRGTLSLPRRYRALRGSHLVFDAARVPAVEAAAFRHPVDGRYLFALPWEGRTVLGVTDLDHDRDLALEPRASDAEVAYLLEGAAAWLPRAQLGQADVVSTFAGVRAVIGSGRANTYLERRESVVSLEHGLLTVTAGKLTSFQAAVLKVMQRAGFSPATGERQSLFEPLDPASLRDLPAATAARLLARYGTRAGQIAAAATAADLEMVADTPVLWVEVREAVSNELITHLDDLLLRRTRIGQLLRDGGRSVLPRVRTLCQPALGWDDARWGLECTRYLAAWRDSYASVGHDPALAREA